ncbi:MAG TPA: heavy-metal-associated domain-containing protein, partial [Bacteroidales bacterium]|nr:heavy-metal-associated domain-containing protein [Bacteroidales bacterium]
KTSGHGRQSDNFNNFSTYKTYSVEGMTCNHCKANVENGISSLIEKGDIFADPSANELRIANADIPEEKIKETIESLGYTFKGKKTN